MRPGFQIRSGRPGDARRLAVLATQVWLHTYATDGVTDEISQYVLSEFTVERFLAFWVSPQQVFSSPTTTGASLALRSSGLVRRAHRAQGQQSSCKHSMSKSTLSVKVSEGRFFKPRRLRHASGQLPRCG